MQESALNYLSLRIGKQWYGIEVAQVIEVLHLVAFTPLPTQRDDILGLITVRDMVMPLLDLRRRFGLKDTSLNLDTPVVAIRDTNGPIALLVDDADRVEQIGTSQITSYQDSQGLPYIRAVAKLPEHLLLLLDTNRISREIHSAPAHNLHVTEEGTSPAT